MAYSRVAAVTGANKGIGFAIVRNLALEYPKSSLNNGPLLIYLTARNEARGEQAIKDIESDAQLKSAKALKQDGGLTDVKFHKLDVSEDSSIQSFKQFIAKTHPDGIDILVNNAGIAIDGFDADKVATTLQCNYYGVVSMTQSFLPHMRRGGRIVNVSSIIGKLNKYSPALVDAFRGASTTAQVTDLMRAFHASVAAGTHAEDGWPTTAYGVSKAGVTGFTRIIGRGEEARERGVAINAVCPGFVLTDLTKGRGVKTVDQGAQTPVFLALGDLQGVTGEFWQSKSVVDW